MRNRLLSGSPSVRLGLVSLVTLLVALAISGCGGGGGGGGGTPPPGGGGGTKATITGKAVDENGNPVPGATLTVVGGPGGVSTALGVITIPNVPLTSTRFTVTPPAGYESGGYGYNATNYPSQDVNGVTCGLPLPVPLQAGQTYQLGTIVIRTNAFPPPPPPTGGCPQ